MKVQLDEVEEKIRKIIAEQLKVDEALIKNDSRVSELGGNSLLTLEVLAALEQHFDISIPDEDAIKIDSFKNCVNVVKKYIKTSY